MAMPPSRSRLVRLSLAAALISASCGGGDGECPGAFEAGGDGHAEPLAAAAGEARAGRAAAADLPQNDRGLLLWEEGDFILANNKVGMVIEDAGPSDLYDPWGGRPLGVGRIENGQLVDVGEFGELFVLTGRSSIVTTSVSVIADGSDGGAAIVRASGRMAPIPFYENIAGAIFRGDYNDIETAIDYVLEPDAEYVDIRLTYHSPRDLDTDVESAPHIFMFTKRAGVFAPSHGFGAEAKAAQWVGMVDPGATSYAYEVPGEEELGAGLAVSGFAAYIASGFTIPKCAESTRHYARVTIGGPGIDGLRQAVARQRGDAQREITGTVSLLAGGPAEGVRVHAETTDGTYLSRAITDATGAYSVHVPDGTAVRLTAWRRGDSVVGPDEVAAGVATKDFQLGGAGWIHVTAEDDNQVTLPVRVQILPVSGDPPGVPENFGEPAVTTGRLHVDYAVTGETTLPVPAGEWRVVVSRGYEYEIHDDVYVVADGETVDVDAVLERSVDTTGQICADFHIHTLRSPDSGDDAVQKLKSAVADGLELPVRSDHEWVNSFAGIIDSLGLDAWAFGIGSVELTSMQFWGHMGVFPLVADPALRNNGAPNWQTWPTQANPDGAFETLTPTDVFETVRARAEEPVLIINHPRGGANYFDYGEFDPTTGMANNIEGWDEEFLLVEVFNDSGWKKNLDETVADWFSFLKHGRRVFAVGSSDSHGITSSPVGYPRTCLAFGSDDPAALTPNMVRDVASAGQSIISGGIYVDATVAGVGPGGTATGVPATTNVSVTVQAATWVAVDWIDVVVDGDIVDTIEVLPGDAVDGIIRFQKDIEIQVAPTLGSFVVVAAYSDTDLSPVHRGRVAFGVTNPIFVTD